MSTWYYGHDELANVAAAAVDKFRKAGIEPRKLEPVIRSYAEILATYSAYNRQAWIEAYGKPLTSERTAADLFERAANMCTMDTADVEAAAQSVRLMAYNLDDYRRPDVVALLDVFVESIPGARREVA